MSFEFPCIQISLFGIVLHRSQGNTSSSNPELEKKMHTLQEISQQVTKETSKTPIQSYSNQSISKT